MPAARRRPFPRGTGTPPASSRDRAVALFADLPGPGVRGWCEADARFAEWKPYTNPKTKRSGWISGGGQVRYTKPAGAGEPAAPVAGGGATQTPAAAPRAAAKAGPDRAAAEAKARTLLSGSGPLAPADAADLAGHLKALTVPQIKALKAEHGLGGGRVKQQHIDALIAHAKARTAGARPAIPAGEPEPSPATAALAVRGPDGRPRTTPGVPAEARAYLAAATPAEVGAIRDYTVNSFGGLNAALRRWGTPAGYEHVDGPLQSAFARTPAYREPVTVRRGIGVAPDLLPAAVAPFERAAATGEPVGGLGYLSTSATGVAFPGNVQFTIAARRGIDLEPYSSNQGGAGLGEVLLDRTSRYKVSAVTRTGPPDRPRYRVEMEEVPAAPPAKPPAGGGAGTAGFVAGSGRRGIA